MARSALASVVLLALLTGCTTTGTPPPALPERYSLPESRPPQQAPAEGAIYNSATGLNLYKDTRASAVGDIILVRIVETSSGKKEAKTKTERESSVSGGVSSFFGFEQWLAERNSRFSPSATEVQATLTNDYDGKGNTERKSDVKATISARVIEKTMDGNLVIRGYQEVRVNNETQTLILSGIIRPSDISADNAVLSSRIADARIEYSGQGVIGDKQQPGWLARAFDVIWPF
ncbi:MAG: flagellar basal body L-ring protein FlgH [Thermodesulfobacteriota bacterium]